MIFSAMCHQKALSQEAGLSDVIAQKKHRYYALFAQYKAVHMLSQELTKLTSEFPEPVLIAMLCIGCYQWDEVVPKRMSDFNPSFKNNEAHAIFMQFEPEDAHVYAVFNMLIERGGLGAITFPGVAAALS